MQTSLQKSLLVIRLSLFFGAVLYGLFGLLDHIILGPDAVTVWIIRYAGVCPVLLGVMALTYHPRFQLFAQPALAASTMSAGLGVVAMTIVIEPPASYSYYAGLIMVVIYASSLIRLRYQYSAAAALALVGAYETVAIWLNPIPLTMLVNNNFFLVMAMAIGVFSNYVLELYYRKDYVSRQLLIREKSSTDVLLREAQAANEAKSDFLAVVSHELRTPLNAIIGFSEIMKTGVFGPLGSKQYAGYAEDIYDSGHHLLEIINDILDLSKAEAGKLEVRETEIDLHALMEDCLRIFRDKAASAGLRIALTPIDSVVLRADQRLIRQAIINLLSNAVKFTEQGGAITVAVRREASGECVIEIADTGVGIKEDDCQKVLEPFVQAESALSRTHDGTGLGLPLVKKIVELHDGSLTLISRFGVGTTVQLRFPAERASVPPAREEFPTLVSDRVHHLRSANM